MTTTNTNTAAGLNSMISDEQIRALRTEAAQAGDHAQALICDIATGAVDPDEGYDHLRIWSFLAEADQRKIAKLDTAAARAVCAEVIEAGHLAGIGKADVIKRVVARCIADKVWRSACEAEATGYASKTERKAVLAYVKAEYDAAGAGFSGRWQ